MKSINVAMNNFQMGVSTNGSGKAGKEEEKTEQIKNGSVFVGNMNSSMMTDRIDQRREQARKQASKIVADQFAGDREVTDNMEERRTKIAALTEENAVFTQEKKYFTEEKEKLKEIYGIEGDSEEQQDLELIQKAQKAMQNGTLGDLSKEELERVANMGELTEYQSRTLEYDVAIEYYDSMIEDNKAKIIGGNGAIRSTKLAMLKDHSMVDTQKAADKIEAAASDAIAGMLMEEARKHIDEEMEKLTEAAKAAAEKKKAEEDKLEEVRDEKHGQEELVEVIQESITDQSKLQQEVDKILKDSELLEEDMKGLIVDGLL